MQEGFNKAHRLAQRQTEQVLDGQTKLMAASENLGMRPRLQLAEANHCMRLSSQIVNEPRDFKAAL
jgi:hypothetical protein